MTRARDLADSADKDIVGTLTLDGLTVAGNVGIGTDSPTEELHVYSDSAPVVLIEGAADNDARLRRLTPNDRIGYIEFADSEDFDTGEIRYEHSSNNMVFSTNGTSEAMRIDSSGNVGIGTASPSSALHLNVASPVLTIQDADGVGAAATPFIIGSDSAGLTQWRVGNLSSGTSDLYIDSANASGTRFTSGGSEAMRIDSSGRVGIGTSSPSSKLHINTGSYGEALRFQASIETSGYYTIGMATGAGLAFSRDGTERMRIDSSGNILSAGKTVLSDAEAGHAFAGGANAGLTYHTTDNSLVMSLCRLSTDGDILRFRKDSTTVGSIGVDDNASDTNKTIYISSGNTIASLDVGFKFDWSSNQITPCQSGGTNRDNAVDLGSNAVRFDDIYATNGTIQTSDRNEKQDIEVLSDAEQRVAVACKGLLRKFRWIDAVAEKGNDARIHFGIIAQDLQDAFAAEGLDAGHYAMFISSTWTDEETGEERTRLGVRYPELLAFIIAAI